MTTSTAITLNGIIGLGLLAILAFVMHFGHRAAGSKIARAVHWSAPLEPERVRLTGQDFDLERAA